MLLAAGAVIDDAAEVTAPEAAASGIDGSVASGGVSQTPPNFAASIASEDAAEDAAEIAPPRMPIVLPPPPRMPHQRMPPRMQRSGRRIP